MADLILTMKKNTQNRKTGQIDSEIFPMKLSQQEFIDFEYEVGQTIDLLPAWPDSTFTLISVERQQEYSE